MAETILADNQVDQELIINLELSPKILPTAELRQLTQAIIFENLTKLNAEFRKLSNSIGSKARPIIKLTEFGSPKFEITKSKLNWIDKKVKIHN